MSKQYTSELSAALHETAQGLHQAGVITKKQMNEYDNRCLKPVKSLKPEAIRKLRKRELASQAVFAVYLNVSKNLISDWERGVKKPGGPALKLLSIVQKHGLQALT